MQRLCPDEEKYPEEFAELREAVAKHGYSLKTHLDAYDLEITHLVIEADGMVTRYIGYINFSQTMRRAAFRAIREAAEERLPDAPRRA